MPNYRYRCENGHDFTEWVSIHVVSITATCECGAEADKVFTTPNISVYATPNKGANVRAVDQREAGWDKDLPAYKAIRKQGLQPRSIDGAHELQDVKHPLEIEMGVRFPKDKLNLALETHADLKENARHSDTPAVIGKHVRGES